MDLVKALPRTTHRSCSDIGDQALVTVSRERAFIQEGIRIQWEREWKESNNGGHLRRIDNTLPAKYTRRLYGSLPRNRAYLLTQLRTGHCWLSTYAKAFRFQDDDLCVCGNRESVTHVLLDYPNLTALRTELRRKVGDAFGSVSVLLGGSGEGEDVSLIAPCEPRRWKPCWISRRRHNGFEVARHEGSLTMKTATRPRQASARL